MNKKVKGIRMAMSMCRSKVCSKADVQGSVAFEINNRAKLESALLEDGS
jgi:hypothetical protein